MTTPVSGASSTSVQHVPNHDSSPATSIGLGSVQSTISSSANPDANPNYWDQVKTGFDSFSEFIRNLIAKALENIRSSLGFVAKWIHGKASNNTTGASTTQTQWQLPPETRSPAPSSPTTTQDPFASLVIQDEEMQKIYTLIHTIGTSQGVFGWVTLLREKNHMERLGQEVNHVHPFKFLEYICKHETLKRDLDSLSQGAYTWRPFVDGISEKFRREAANLAQYRIGFARSLDLNLADIDPYISRSDWEGFVRFLIDVKNGRRTSAWVEPASNAPTTYTPPGAGNSNAISTTVPIPPMPNTLAVTTISIPPPDAASTSSIIPLPVPRLAELPLEREDERTIADLMSRYDNHNRVRLAFESLPLFIQWRRLDSRHALKLLSYLYSNAALMDHMNNILNSNKKNMFLSAFAERLSRTQFDQARPYIPDFAQICRLDANQMEAFIQNGQWPQLVEAMNQSYQNR